MANYTLTEGRSQGVSLDMRENVPRDFVLGCGLLLDAAEAQHDEDERFGDRAELVDRTYSSGMCATRTSPGPNSTVGMRPTLTRRRMSAP